MKIKNLAEKITGLVVLVEVNKKVHQVMLDKNQTDSIKFILPQLFEDGVVKVSGEVLESISFIK